MSEPGEIGDRAGDFVGEELDDDELGEFLEIRRERAADAFLLELDPSDAAAPVALDGVPFARVGVRPVHVRCEIQARFEGLHDRRVVLRSGEIEEGEEEETEEEMRSGHFFELVECTVVIF